MVEERTNVQATYRENIPSAIRRIAVFASYSGDGRIADYVVYYLQELRKVVDVIAFVADNTIYLEELQKIEKIVAYVSCTHHGAYDFGSYKKGFVWLEEQRLLNNTEELVFCNDSCYGPVFPLGDAFKKMENVKCDFWGLLDSCEDAHHILSFFLVFRNSAFASPVFCNFVHSFKQQKSFWNYVNKYEKGFTSILEEAGFTSATYITIDEETRLRCAYLSGNGNLMVCPVTLHRYGMPLVKVKALNNVFGQELKESPLRIIEEISKVNETLWNIIVADLERRGVKAEDRWLEPSDIVKDADVVSFDIFDTLLARPYKQPTDLFLQMEKELNRQGFCKKRVAAEIKARKAHPEQADVTLSQIYEQIGSAYVDLKDEELRFEHDLLFVKEDIRRIYEEAVRQNKKIIAVSDMYLPKEFLENVLREKGYTAVSDLFVSNEENCCKGDGKLFERVLQKLNVKPSAIVHIGDNPISDKKAPEKLGIRSVLKCSYIATMYDSPSMAKLQCFSKTKKLSRSFLTGVICQHVFSKPLQDPFREIGYTLGGPLAVGYMKHVYAEAKTRGIDTILFVSRDGYVLNEIFDKVCPHDIRHYYLQTSRLLTLRNSVDYDVEKFRRKVFEIYIKEHQIELDYSEENYHAYIDDMRIWAEENRKRYANYIEDLHIQGNRMMTVDMTTYEYTSLKTLKALFGERIACGMFSITFGMPCNDMVLSYSKKRWKPGDESLLMFQEELITAPEAAACTITEDGQFVYSDENQTERWRIEHYKRIMAGIHEYVDDFNRLSAGHNIIISFHDNWELLKNYVWVANYGDHQLYKQMYHEDAVEGTYNSLSHYIKNRRKELDDMEDTEKIYPYKKKQKHIRTIRCLIYALGAETLAIIALLAYLFMS